MRGPFRACRIGSVWSLEIDTPGSSINIFTSAAAAQLLELLRARPSSAQAVVLRSRKAGSFINGAELLLAGAASSPARVDRAAGPVRAAYAALAACPVPTLAVIEGNCLGCGLELALCCRWRVARDSVDTRFRMTELSDYRLIPAFGGTQRLPRLIGVEPSAELLLDGATWDARAARARGLVDAVFRPQGFGVAVDDWLRRRLGSRPRNNDRSAPAADTNNGGRQQRRGDSPHVFLKARLAEVPPPRRPLWARCASLVEAAPRTPLAVGLSKEAAACRISVASRAAKQATSFFFVRHMARAATFGTADQSPPRRPVELVGLPDSPAVSRPWLPSGTSGRAIRVRATVGLAEGDAVFPNGFRPGALCEIAGPQPEAAREVARHLEWCGFTAVVTRPDDGPVARRLARRYFQLLSDVAARGVGVPAIERALWNAGFAKMPREHLRAWGGVSAVSAQLDLRRPDLVTLTSTGRRVRGRAAPELFDALCVAMADEIDRCVGEGELRHASQGDVLASCLLDFPLEEGSFLLRVERLRLKGMPRR